MLMDKKTSRYLTIGTLLTLAGGVCWAFSGACGQFLMQQRGVNAGWLVTVMLRILATIYRWNLPKAI